jgi:hypothetical protein
MTEQINQESNDSVETPTRDAVDVFTEILEAEESNDKPEVTNEKQEDIEENVEETETEAESEEEVEESDEDEPDTEDEDDDEESDEDEVEVEEVQTFVVKANGEEKNVSLNELVEGYQKGTDYTKKSQVLAEQRKAVEAEAHAVQEAMQLREQYAHRLNQVSQLLESSNGEVDLADLKENDPIQYAIAVAEKTENTKKLQLINEEQGRLAQAQQQQVAQHQAKVVAYEAKMLTDKVADFSDPKKSEQLKGEIRNFGKSIGFTDQELGQVFDHRHVMVMQKAMMYDKLQKANPSVNKKLAKAPKMSKKGNKVTNVDAYTKQKKRLKSSGNIEDATELFKNFI